MAKKQEILRDCKVCGRQIPKRPLQSDDARTCRPKCARDLAYQENPHLGGFKSSNGAAAR